jgi:pimeloyl-ACP methyl ester carboxylesterase
MKIEQVFFNSNGLRLFGALFRPESETNGQAVVVCHPFAEEKKSAQKPLVDLASALAAAGYSVLLFDFQGYGDSSGLSVDCTLSDWNQNIHDAANFIKQSTACQKIIVIGLRMSAALALVAARERNDIIKLIMVEPVSSFIGGFKEAVKQKMVNELLTVGKVHGSTDKYLQDLEAGKTLDLDGYEIGSSFLRSCHAMENRLRVADVRSNSVIKAISISPSGSPTRNFTAFCKLTGVIAYAVAALKLEAFWNRIDGIDCTLFIDTMVNLCDDDGN